MDEKLESGLPSTAIELSKALEGTAKERMEGERTILLKITPGQRPEVIFTGFWNGKYIKAARSSIARAYRLRRHKPQAKPEAKFENTPRVVDKGGKGDGR